jgi:hypothetical protein
MLHLFNSTCAGTFEDSQYSVEETPISQLKLRQDARRQRVIQMWEYRSYGA